MTVYYLYSMLERLYMIQFLKTNKIIFLAIIIAFFSITALGTSLLHQKKVEKLPQRFTTPVFQRSTSTSTWPVYRNDELGFEIQIPQRWVDEYKIDESRTTGEGFGSVSFSKKSEWTSPTGAKMSYNYRVLGIVVVTPEWWKEEISYNQPHPGLIKMTDKKVYIYNVGQDIGSDYEYEEIKEIVSAFKLIQ